jgi:acetyl esterase/lipase
MNWTRRAVLGAASAAGAAIALPRIAFATEGDVEEIDLWPGTPPGPGGGHGPEHFGMTKSGQGAISGVTRPRIRVYRPAKPNGTAMLVMGGGGYFRIELANESSPTCRWLQTLGTTAFELIYRMPADGWPREAPFADAQRAMRLIRARAGDFEFDAEKLGVIGFSAGGHLAGMTAVMPDAPRYAPIDAIDQHSARPAAAGLIYPVLTLEAPYDTTRSVRELLGTNRTQEQAAEWSVQTHVSGRTPPVFTAQAADDPIAPIANSLLMFDALQKAGVKHEMHIFQEGGHGWGLGDPGSLVSAWPRLFASWARTHDLMPLGFGGSAAPAPSPADDRNDDDSGKKPDDN